jgi:hypothetical protein
VEIEIIEDASAAAGMQQAGYPLLTLLEGAF